MLEIAYVITGIVVGFFANKAIEENRPKNRARLRGNSSFYELAIVRAEEQESITPKIIPSGKVTPTPEVVLPPQESEDLAALREQLKQTQLAYYMAQEMSWFKAGFLARTSHELRSPLSSLIGLHQLIISDLCEDPAEEREFIVEANKSALKLVKLMDEVIAVAKTEHGTANLELQPINLEHHLLEVYNLTHLQATNRSLRLQISPPSSTVYVMAEPRRLRQVLVNLVDRAILKMQLGGISLSVAPVDPGSSQVTLWIDADCDPQEWVEPIDLLHHPVTEVHEKLSPGLNFLLDQTILEVMGGKLEAVEGIDANTTRLQCSLPAALEIMELAETN